MKTIEVIARGIMIEDGKILLCKSVDRGHYYLPGGHVEFGESGEAALIREMQEECGNEIGEISFSGIFENVFDDSEGSHHEINLLYAAKLKSTAVISKESHIAFEWVALADISTIKFVPKGILPSHLYSNTIY